MLGTEMVSILTEQLKGQLAETERFREEAVESRVRAVQAESDAKVATAVADAATRVAQAEAKRMHAEASAGKVSALQLRLESLHVAELLDEDTLFAIEDKIADAIQEAEAGSDGASDDARGCVAQMVALSEGIVSDKMFSRQLKRKFA
jgi:hypothetical protein